MAEHYKLSGRVPFNGLLRVALFGLTAAAFLSAAYSYANVYIPRIYLKFLVTIGFGALLGWFVGSSARTGKVRNTMFVVIAGLVIGCVALYFAWAIDMFARLGRMEGVEGPRLTFDPRAIWRYITVANEHGLWSIRGHTPTCWELGLYWSLEASVIVGAAMIVPASMLSGRAFCEACDRWIATEHDLLRLDSSALGTVTNSLEIGNVAGLADAPIVGNEADRFLRVDLSCCPRCGESNYLTVKSLTTTINKQGKAEVKEDDVRLLQRITASDRDYIRELGACAQAEQTEALESAAALAPEPNADEPAVDERLEPPS